MCNITNFDTNPTNQIELDAKVPKGPRGIVASFF